MRRKKLQDMDADEVQAFLDKVSSKLDKMKPPDSVYIVLFAAECNDCKGGVSLLATDCDKLDSIDLLRDQADRIEGELIQSN